MRLVGRIDLVSNPAIFTFWSLIHLIVAIIVWIVIKIIIKDISDTTLFITLFVSHAIYETKDQLVAKECRRKELNGETVRNPLEKGCINSLENSIGDQFMFTLGLVIAILLSKVVDCYNWKFCTPIIIVCVAMMIVSPIMKWG